LHCTVIGTLLASVLLPDGCSLNDAFCPRYPFSNETQPASGTSKLCPVYQNVLFVLHHHLNHPRNAKLGRMLAGLGPAPTPTATWRASCPPFIRLLRLLCVELFTPEVYDRVGVLGSGAYGDVFACVVKPADRLPCFPSQLSIGTPVAVKVSKVWGFWVVAGVWCRCAQLPRGVVVSPSCRRSQPIAAPWHPFTAKFPSLNYAVLFPVLCACLILA
jgi:hypothetical protein